MFKIWTGTKSDLWVVCELSYDWGAEFCAPAHLISLWMEHKNVTTKRETKKYSVPIRNKKILNKLC